MKYTLRLTIILLMLLIPVGSATAGDPLPGTCGLADPLTSTLAFAGPTLRPDVHRIDVSMASCQAMDFSTVYVYGCTTEQFTNGDGHGALNLSLSQAGFITPYRGSTTLLDVISHPGTGEIDEHGIQTYDPFLVKAVTGYLNSLYVENYEYKVQEVLDGYHTGSISEGSFAWNNDGAFGRDVVSSCTLD